MRIIQTIIAAAVLTVTGCLPDAAHKTVDHPASVANPILNVPMNAADGNMPRLLSQVGAFADLRARKPAAGLVEYEINVPFWSDGAQKGRWIDLPPGKRITFARDGEWHFPAGTVFVKTFDWPSDDGTATTPIETRVLVVCDDEGGVTGASYRWRADGSDADLVSEPLTVSLPGREGDWYFPGTADCRVCHTKVAGGVLGVKTRQMNRPVAGRGENQLVRWERLGMFEPGAAALIGDGHGLTKLVSVADRSASVADRARSFLDANCAHCHRPGGVAGNFDARFDTPLPQQNLVDGPVLIDLGIDRARVIAPRDVWRSLALVRVETSDLTRMPPLAHLRVDAADARLLREWIESMPGPAVLAPPVIQTKGGEFHGSVRVVINHSDPAATIHYTLDGSAPGKSSPVYTGPVEIREPGTLRARAYRNGFTRSIIVQDTFVVDD